MMRFAIGTIHTRRFAGRVVDSIRALTPPEDGFVWLRIPDLPVDLARDELVRRFLAYRPKLEWLFQFDSDMTFAPESLARLASRGKKLISALCITRMRPPVPAIFGEVTRVREDGREFLRIESTETFEWLLHHPEALEECPCVLDPSPEDALVQKNGAGAAFLLAHRDVFEGISVCGDRSHNGDAGAHAGAPLQADAPVRDAQERWFVRDTLKRGEDFFFFAKAREAGFKLWIDRSVICGHEWGEQYVGPKDFMVWALGQPLLEAALAHVAEGKDLTEIVELVDRKYET